MAASNKELSPGTGWVFFAGIMMILSGIFKQLLASQHCSGQPGISPLRPTCWCLTTRLGAGLTWLSACWYCWPDSPVLHGSTWARFVAVFLACLSAIGALTFISAYPIWSIIVIVVDIVVIHALVVHGGELKD